MEKQVKEVSASVPQTQQGSTGSGDDIVLDIVDGRQQEMERKRLKKLKKKQAKKAA